MKGLEIVQKRRQFKNTKIMFITNLMNIKTSQLIMSLLIILNGSPLAWLKGSSYDGMDSAQQISLKLTAILLNRTFQLAEHQDTVLHSSNTLWWNGSWNHSGRKQSTAATDSRNGTVEMGWRTWDGGSGTGDVGRWTRDGGHGKVDMGKGARGSGHGKVGMGCWIWDGGHGKVDMKQWTWDSGYGTVYKGQWTWNKGHGTEETHKKMNKLQKIRNGNRVEQLKIIHWNLGSKLWCNKLEDIELLLTEFKPDLCYISEANLWNGLDYHEREILGHEIIYPNTMERLGTCKNNITGQGRDQCGKTEPVHGE